MTLLSQQKFWRPAAVCNCPRRQRTAPLCFSRGLQKSHFFPIEKCQISTTAIVTLFWHCFILKRIRISPITSPEIGSGPGPPDPEAHAKLHFPHLENGTSLCRKDETPAPQDCHLCLPTRQDLLPTPEQHPACLSSPHPGTRKDNGQEITQFILELRQASACLSLIRAAPPWSALENGAIVLTLRGHF